MHGRKNIKEQDSKQQQQTYARDQGNCCFQKQRSLIKISVLQEVPCFWGSSPSCLEGL